MKAEELTGFALKMAEMAIAEQGKVLSMILVHAAGNVIALPYKDGSMPVNLQQDLIISTIKAIRKTGTFEGMVMVSEAWVAAQTNPALAGVLRPAQDPDRKEVVAAYARGDDGSSRFMTAAIVREGDKVRLAAPEPMPAGIEMKSWIDDAFQD